MLSNRCVGRIEDRFDDIIEAGGRPIGCPSHNILRQQGICGSYRVLQKGRAVQLNHWFQRIPNHQRQESVVDVGNFR